MKFEVVAGLILVRSAEVSNGVVDLSHLLGGHDETSVDEEGPLAAI